MGPTVPSYHLQAFRWRGSLFFAIWQISVEPLLWAKHRAGCWGSSSKRRDMAPALPELVETRAWDIDKWPTITTQQHWYQSSMQTRIRENFSAFPAETWGMSGNWWNGRVGGRSYIEGRRRAFSAAPQLPSSESVARRHPPSWGADSAPHGVSTVQAGLQPLLTLLLRQDWKMSGARGHGGSETNVFRNVAVKDRQEVKW